MLNLKKTVDNLDRSGFFLIISVQFRQPEAALLPLVQTKTFHYMLSRFLAGLTVNFVKKLKCVLDLAEELYCEPMLLLLFC
jgi:hypothetical protein